MVASFKIRGQPLAQERPSTIVNKMGRTDMIKLEDEREWAIKKFGQRAECRRDSRVENSPLNLLIHAI
jgi:hypothetical protein